VTKYFNILAAVFLAVAFPLSAAQAQEAANTAMGNAENGKRVFNRCKACHNLTDANRTRLGPNLDNLFGRKAGSATNYKYSRALAEADFEWTEDRLDEWFMKPSSFLPGNKMTFAGLRKEKDRKDLIAYLRQATVKLD